MREGISPAWDFIVNICDNCGQSYLDQENESSGFYCPDCM